MLIEPIEDVSSEEQYIQDLETEVEVLRAQVKSLMATLNKPRDTISKDKYLKVCSKLQELYSKDIPF